PSTSPTHHHPPSAAQSLCSSVSPLSVMERGGQCRQSLLIQRRILEDQVELWWFRDPQRSLLCYCASVALILGLGLGGVGLLSTTTSLSGEWRLGVGTTLCLLALAVLLKQLLSSAIQDMNCVRSRRRIDQLKSGGRADPALILAVGLAVMLCGTVLIFVATIGSQGHDSREMLVSGLVLMAAGTGMSLAVAGYSVLAYIKRRRDQRRRRRMRRMRRRGNQYHIYTVWLGRNINCQSSSLLS
uniref:Transmembrane protein 125b n=1 Tax=Neolamprologus brichardi TaxID=32507 RepID=A0A3Q4GX12_NEOBR